MDAGRQLGSSVIAILLLLVQSWIGRAADPGAIDPGFVPEIPATTKCAVVSLLTPSGKTLIWGDFHQVNGTRRPVLARLNGDGTLDQTFQSPLGSLSSLRHVALAVDEKVFVVGDLISTNGTSLPEIVRLNQDGSLDTEFDCRRVDDSVSKILPMADGKLIVAGRRPQLSEQRPPILWRLNVEGAIDESFNEVLIDGEVSTLLQGPEGKIVVVGFWFRSAADPVELPRERPIGSIDISTNISTGDIVRLNADGSLDETFQAPDIRPSEVALDSEGRIYFTEFTRPYPSEMMRLRTDGSLDSDYHPSEEARFVSAMASLPNGKMVVRLAGVVRGSRLLRLDSEGQVDLHYDTTQMQGSGVIVGGHSNFNVLPDGTLLDHLQRFRPDGIQDLGFRPRVERIDGHAVILGVNSENVLARNVDGFGPYIRKMDITGAIDDAFQATLEANFIETVKSSPDGTLWGQTSFFGGDGIVKLTTTGQIERELLKRGQDEWLVWLPLEEGQMLVARNDLYGEFPMTLTRYLESGDVDGSFSYGGPIPPGQYDKVYEIMRGGNGGIFIEGFFADQYTNYSFKVMRLKLDGSFDQSFTMDPGLENQGLSLLACDVDGRVLLGQSGHYSQSSEYPDRPILKRTNPDGSLDESFRVNFGMRSGVTQALVQRDGKILVIGRIFDQSNQQVRTILRLLPDGSEDSSFRLPDGDVASIVSVAIQRNGDILVGGAFDRIGGLERNGMARIISMEQPSMRSVTRAGNKLQMQFSANPGRTALIQTSTNLQDWETIQILPVVSEDTAIELPVASEASRFYRAVLLR